MSVEKIRKQCRKTPNWKAPGRDGVQGYWIKNLSSLHECVSSQTNGILMAEDDLPEWMTHGRTVLCQKDPRKGNTADNYRPITCLPLMWKLLTGVIAEEMYNYLEQEKILPEEQKGCKRGSRGTKDQLLIDKTVLKNCRKRHTNLSMAWIDYRKAYDLAPHSWVIECMETFGIAENLRTFLQKSMQQWRLSLTANGEDLGEVNVKRGIFQGDSLSHLLFVLSMVPLSLILKKVNACYKWGKKEYKLNHLLFMDDLKLHAKSEEQTNTLVRTVYVFSTDIGMEFGIKKCGLHPKSDVDRLYVKRQVGGRDLISVTRCITEEENSLGFCVANSEENLIGVSTTDTTNTRETITSVEFKKQREKELKEKWSEKRMHGQFIRETTEKVDKEKTWQWLSRGDLKVGTEALLCAVQEQAIRTNYIKYIIDKTGESPLCRLCGEKR